MNALTRPRPPAADSAGLSQRERRYRGDSGLAPLPTLQGSSDLAAV